MKINERISNMKFRKVVLCLTIAMIAANLSGCSMNNDNSSDEQKLVYENVMYEDEKSETKRNEWGIALSVNNDVESNGLTLWIDQKDGKFDGELEYGSDYSIMVYKDGKYEELPYVVDNVAWTSEAYVLELNSKIGKYINWEPIYGELQPGKYKIGKQFMNFRETGDYDTETLWCEFVIE